MYVGPARDRIVRGGGGCLAAAAAAAVVRCCMIQAFFLGHHQRLVSFSGPRGAVKAIFRVCILGVLGLHIEATFCSLFAFLVYNSGGVRAETYSSNRKVLGHLISPTHGLALLYTLLGMVSLLVGVKCAERGGWFFFALLRREFVWSCCFTTRV